MTVIVTRDVASRIRGFLASCMLELSPGVYVTPRMSPAVRERVWGTIEGWFETIGGSSMVMIYPDRSCPGGHGIKIIGTPPVELKDFDDVVLSYRKG